MAPREIIIKKKNAVTKGEAKGKDKTQRLEKETKRGVTVKTMCTGRGNSGDIFKKRNGDAEKKG